MPQCTTTDPDAPVRRFGCEHLACAACGPSCTLCNDYVKRKVRKIAEDVNRRRASANAANDAAKDDDDDDDDDDDNDDDADPARDDDADADDAAFELAGADGAGDARGMLFDAIARLLVVSVLALTIPSLPPFPSPRSAEFEAGTPAQRFAFPDFADRAARIASFVGDPRYTSLTSKPTAMALAAAGLFLPAQPDGADPCCFRCGVIVLFSHMTTHSSPVEAHQQAVDRDPGRECKFRRERRRYREADYDYESP